MINGAKAPDLPDYPFNSQLKLTAINIPSFGSRKNAFFIMNHIRV